MEEEEDGYGIGYEEHDPYAFELKDDIFDDKKTSKNKKKDTKSSKKETKGPAGKKIEKSEEESIDSEEANRKTQY